MKHRHTDVDNKSEIFIHHIPAIVSGGDLMKWTSACCRRAMAVACLVRRHNNPRRLRLLPCLPGIEEAAVRARIQIR